ncbi:hypothetical protein SpCBS45565_g08336 [Spizellomyces sp. 'palustris']|nr:hypothetical protein SpCBS45565_g08336 [Spizellomyces sp. 'palustris']
MSTTTANPTPLVSLVIKQVISWLGADFSQQSPTVPLTPLVVGLTGPQGIGKTTLVRLVVQTLTSSPYNLKATHFSLDDLYYPHATLKDIAKSNADNPLLQWRGNPGTHDIALGEQVLEAFKRGNQTKKDILIPVYDKSLNHGRGDRVDQAHWNKAQPPFHLIILEGWCLGFTPPTDISSLYNTDTVPDASLTPAFPHLCSHSMKHIQALLEHLTHQHRLTKYMNALIHIHPSSLSHVYTWRLEQEHTMKALNGGHGMSDQEVKEFVDMFMPLYAACLPGLFERGWQGEHYLRVTLDERREILDVKGS